MHFKRQYVDVPYIDMVICVAYVYGCTKTLYITICTNYLYINACIDSLMVYTNPITNQHSSFDHQYMSVVVHMVP